MPKNGEIRISPAGVYSNGYRIELWAYHNMSEKSWAVPAWDKMNYPELVGPFPTFSAAHKARTEAGV